MRNLVIFLFVCLILFNEINGACINAEISQPCCPRHGFQFLNVSRNIYTDELIFNEQDCIVTVTNEECCISDELTPKVFVRSQSFIACVNASDMNANEYITADHCDPNLYVSNPNVTYNGSIPINGVSNTENWDTNTLDINNCTCDYTVNICETSEAYMCTDGNFMPGQNLCDVGNGALLLGKIGSFPNEPKGPFTNGDECYCNYTIEYCTSEPDPNMNTGMCKDELIYDCCAGGSIKIENNAFTIPLNQMTLSDYYTSIQGSSFDASVDPTFVCSIDGGNLCTYDENTIPSIEYDVEITLDTNLDWYYDRHLDEFIFNCQCQLVYNNCSNSPTKEPTKSPSIGTISPTKKPSLAPPTFRVTTTTKAPTTTLGFIPYWQQNEPIFFYGAIAGGVLLLLIVCLCCCILCKPLCRKNKKKKDDKANYLNSDSRKRLQSESMANNNNSIELGGKAIFKQNV